MSVVHGQVCLLSEVVSEFFLTRMVKNGLRIHANWKNAHLLCLEIFWTFGGDGWSAKSMCLSLSDVGFLKEMASQISKFSCSSPIGSSLGGLLFSF